MPLDLAERLEALIAAEQRDAALRSFLHEAPGVPEGILDGLQGSPIWIRIAALAHTTPYDARIAGEYNLNPLHLAGLTVPTLLLLGERSPEWITFGTETLARAMLRSHIVWLPGQQHDAHLETPGALANQLIAFAVGEGSADKASIGLG